MKLSELHGKSVVSVTEAVKLGTVDDVLVDSSLGSISALTIAGTERGDRHVVAMDQVRAIGPDVVTVTGQNALMSPNQVSDTSSLVPLRSVLGCRVVAEGGRVLGTVGEIQIDPDSGRVQAIEYGTTGIESIFGNRHRIDPGMVIGVGPKVLTVSDQASPSSESESQAA